MTERKYLLLILLSLLLVQSLILYSPAIADTERIAAWFDYACFDYPPEEDVTLVEFYYGMRRHEMTFAYVDTGFAASAFIWIEITSDDSTAVDTLFKRIVTAVNSVDEIGNKNIRITDQISAILKPGDYIARLVIEDAESQLDGVPMTGKIGERTYRISVPEFGADTLLMSGIELSYKIEALPLDMGVTGERAIDKSGRRIVPNPSRIFVSTDSLMYFYAEVYNLAFGMENNREFRFSCHILDTHGDIVSDFGQRRHFKPGTSAIVSSALDIHDMPEGIYFINLEVLDSETGESASNSKPFQLLPAMQQLAPGTTAETATDEDIDFVEKVLVYHLSTDQKNTLEGLSREGKIRFFEDFWRSNDPDPSTRLNEFKVELFRRFEYANEHYSLSKAEKSDGWQTDRGRVYILYGEPDEVEDYPWALDQKPFEKWDYFNIGAQGARYFIFQDETGYGDYRLAHSNADGEPFDPEWEERIERGQLLNY